LTYFIVTLRDYPTIANALRQGGTPILFVTRKLANEIGIGQMVVREKQPLYRVEPIFVHTNHEKHVIKIEAPEGVEVNIVTNHR
jgi:hypothetical protein